MYFSVTHGYVEMFPCISFQLDIWLGNDRLNLIVYGVFWLVRFRYKIH